MRHTVDRENGGFFGAVDCELRVDKQAARTAVINTRILWTFSAAARVLGDAAYRETADWAYDYIVDKFWDKEFGGVYWMLDHPGRPLRNRKHNTAQDFAAYGLSEYFRATRRAESLERAKQLYRLIEEKSGEPEYGGYLEARFRDWSPLEDLRLSDKDLNCPKSMNTHLHVLEAYTSLLRVWDDPGLGASLAELLRVTMDRIVDGGTGHFKMFFDNQWTSLTDHVSFGHDIEGSWLMQEAAEVLGDRALMERCSCSACATARARAPWPAPCAWRRWRARAAWAATISAASNPACAPTWPCSISAASVTAEPATPFPRSYCARPRRSTRWWWKAAWWSKAAHSKPSRWSRFYGGIANSPPGFRQSKPQSEPRPGHPRGRLSHPPHQAAICRAQVRIGYRESCSSSLSPRD